MSFESAYFERMSLVAQKLLSYGFKPSAGEYGYSETFMDKSFRADITVTEDGKVTGRVIDLDTDEEYLPIRIESVRGSYVGAVREAYAAILRDIAEHCFIRETFLYAQSNRLIRAVALSYGEFPDFPFAKLPTYAVLRYPSNRKWYALIMNIRESLILGKSDVPKDKERIIEILNLKADPVRIDELLGIKGIFPGYHMNRANWISIALDDTVSDSFILDLIDKSRGYAVTK